MTNQYDNRETRLQLLRMSYQHIVNQGRKSVTDDAITGGVCCAYIGPGGIGCAAAPFVRGINAKSSENYKPFDLLRDEFKHPAAAANGVFVQTVLQWAHDRPPQGPWFADQYKAELARVLEDWEVRTGETFTLADAASHSIHTLLIATAIYIEENPEQYNWLNGAVPKEGERPACMLALLGGIAGEAQGTLYFQIARDVLGTSEHVFHDRIKELVDKRYHDAKEAARALRLYADKYHAEAF